MLKELFSRVSSSFDFCEDSNSEWRSVADELGIAILESDRGWTVEESLGFAYSYICFLH